MHAASDKHGRTGLAAVAFTLPVLFLLAVCVACWTLLQHAGSLTMAKASHSQLRVDALLWAPLAALLFSLGFELVLWLWYRSQRSALRKEQEARIRSQSLIDCVTSYSIATLDTQERFLTWNRGAELLYGYTAPEILGKTPAALRPPGNRKSPSYLEAALAHKESVVLEETGVRKDGSLFLAHITVNPVRDQHDHLIGFAITTCDITQQRAAQQQHTRSEQLLRDAQELAGLGHWEIDCTANLVRVSEQAAAFLQIASPDRTCTLEDCLSRVPQANRDSISGEVATALSSGAPSFEWVQQFRKLDGSLAWAHCRAHVDRAPDGTPVQLRGTLLDITHLKTAEAERIELANTEKRLHRLIQTIREVVFEIDAHGHWRFLNSSWTSFTGFSIAETLGKPAIEWLHPSIHETYSRHLMALLKGMIPVLHDEVLVRTSDESFRWMEVIAERAEHAADGGFIVIGTLVDIHERKQTATILRQAREVAEEANRAKSEFLAIISRELRAPLGSLVGMSKVLCNAKLTAQERETALTVRQSTQELLGVLNSLIDLSRFEAGLMKFSPVAVDIRLASEDVLDSYSLEADRKRLDLVLRYQPGIPKRLMTDPGRYRQVLSILVENAIRYSQEGQVIISLWAEHLSKQQLSLHVEVLDSGSGLFPEGGLSPDHTSLRLSKTSPGKKVGLGLELARHLITFLGGRSSVESTPGKGTRIHLHFVCARDPQEWPAPVAPAAFSGRKLLIVEPSLAIHTGLQSMLYGANMQSAQVYDAASALDLLRSEAQFGNGFDAVLFSTESAGLDRDEFVSTLRGLPACSAIPVILLSRSTDMPSRSELAKVGCSHVLRRNPTRQQLWTALSDALKPAYPSSHGPLGNPAAPEVRPGAITPTAPSRKRVLLLACPDTDLASMTAALEQSGCEYSIRRDQAEASALNARTVFDLILLDQAVAGSALAQLIHESGTGPRCPLALVVNSATTPVTRSAGEFEFDQVLPRDFTARDLQNLFFKLHQASADTNPFDLASSLARCANDRQLLCELSEDFRENASRLTPALIKAIAVRDSLAAGDCIEKLRAAAQFFSANALCQQLDQLAGLVNLHDWGSLPRRLSSVRLELNRLCSELPSSAAVADPFGEAVQC